MIDPHDFSRKQLELTGEFGKFVIEHPEVDERLPDGACIYFEIDGETEFNRYSHEIAQSQQKQGVPVVRVRIRGLAPPQGCRLIDPVIDPAMV